MYAGERFNSITHVIGTVMAVVGTAVIVSSAASARAVIASTIYGTMLILAYLSSTLYHSVRGPKKELFHIFDRCAIYLLIAGTYTPFTLLTLRGPVGWWLFVTIWTLAIAGILKDVFFPGRFSIASAMFYLLMGWLMVIAFEPLRQSLPMAGIAWLAAGGILYTVGTIFFALSKHVVHTHGVWHLCVLGGSICHFVAVLRYVA
jgi:hemolysin III